MPEDVHPRERKAGLLQVAPQVAQKVTLVIPCPSARDGQSESSALIGPNSRPDAAGQARSASRAGCGSSRRPVLPALALVRDVLDLKVVVRFTIMSRVPVGIGRK
jgi:hypothetical protein